MISGGDFDPREDSERCPWRRGEGLDYPIMVRILALFTISHCFLVLRHPLHECYDQACFLVLYTKCDTVILGQQVTIV